MINSKRRQLRGFQYFEYRAAPQQVTTFFVRPDAAACRTNHSIGAPLVDCFLADRVIHAIFLPVTFALAPDAAISILSA
jgi:hypothetical protein